MKVSEENKLNWDLNYGCCLVGIIKIESTKNKKLENLNNSKSDNNIFIMNLGSLVKEKAWQTVQNIQDETKRLGAIGNSIKTFHKTLQ